MPEKEQDLGALWIKTGAKGEYMTGTIEVNGEKIGVVCFTNQHKKEAKHPDWRILRARKQEEVPKSNDLPVNEDEINPEDIPF